MSWHSPSLPVHREGPLPARSKLDELLGRGTAAKLLAHPGAGEHREFKLDKKYQKPEGEDAWRSGEESVLAARLLFSVFPTSLVFFFCGGGLLVCWFVF